MINSYTTTDSILTLTKVLLTKKGLTLFSAILKEKDIWMANILVHQKLKQVLMHLKQMFSWIQHFTVQKLRVVTSSLCNGRLKPLDFTSFSESQFCTERTVILLKIFIATDSVIFHMFP